MAVSEDFQRHVVDRLAQVGRVESKRMFGGVGLYLEGTFFGLIAPRSSTLYFRVDDSTRPDYEAEGSSPFRPYAGKPTVMPYYEVPVEVFEDTERLHDWARKAHAAALQARAGKRAPRRRPTRGR
jgi:DNA transformation protein